MKPNTTRRPEHLALLFHAAMAVWIMASIAEAFRRYASAEDGSVPVATLLGTGLGLEVGLLAWFVGGLGFTLLRAMRRG